MSEPTLGRPIAESDDDDYYIMRSTAQQLIASIFDETSGLDASLFSPATNSALRSSSQHSSVNSSRSNDSPPERSQRAPRNVNITPNSREIEQHLEAISDLLEDVDRNLAQHISEMDTPRHRPMPEPEAFIDLSDTYATPAHRAPNVDEDEVIIISSDVNNVVDLCTPIHNNTERRHLPATEAPIYIIQGGHGHSRAGGRVRSRSPQPSVGQSTKSPKCRKTLPAVRTFPSTQHSPSLTRRPGITCPVCMESVINREPTSTKCGHVFCATCIREALRLARKCPMCNKKLTPAALFRLYL